VSSNLPVSWFKSSYSGGNSNCLEAGELRDGIAVRDSKYLPGPVLAIRADAWSSFLAALKTPASRTRRP
jgi:hypothetical protein